MSTKMKRISGILIVISLLLSLTFIPAPVQGSNGPSSTTNSLVYAQFGEPMTLDPVYSYDTAGWYVIDQVYETLIAYNREKTDQFVPLLADSWSISTDNLTYTFHIRPGVKFHNGDSLTPQDVASSFWLDILTGGIPSAQWMISEALLGRGIQDVTLLVDPSWALEGNRTALQQADPSKLLAACNTVKSKITYDDTTGNVVFHLPQAWSPFLNELAISSSSIMDLNWVASNGGWNGDCATWQNYYALTSAEDPLTTLANGTGPYKLDHWTQGTEVGLVSNTSYWVTSPLWSGGPSGTPFFQSVTIKDVVTDSDRVNMLLNGTADLADVLNWDYATLNADVLLTHDAANTTSTLIHPNGFLDSYTGILSQAAFDMFFDYNLNPASPYIGTGTLGGGIPVNFFSDIHVRKAFNYAFNWDQFMSQAFHGYAIQRTGPIIKGDEGYADSQPHYSYNPTQAMNEFYQAWGGQVVAQGFTLTLTYNMGNSSLQIACQILQQGLQALSPKFHVNIVALPWSTILSDYQNSLLPIYIMGWFQDVPTGYDWVEPYLTGVYGSSMNLPSYLADKYSTKISTCLADPPGQTQACYEDIQTSTYADAIGIYLAQGTYTQYASSELRGYYINPAVGEPYLYALSKPVPTVTTVTPTSPSTVQFADGLGSSGSIDLPAGSVSQDTQLVVTPGQTTTGQPSGFLLGDFAFSIQAFDSTGATLSLTFATPVNITITYNPLIQGPLLENTLMLFTWNGSSWVDAACGPYARDLTNHTVTVPVCHFSQFALGGTRERTVYLPLTMR